MKPNGRRRWRRLARKHRQQCAHDAMRAVYTTQQAMRDRRTGYELKPLPPPGFSPRSLVGMTMGARKRAAKVDAWHKAVTYGREVITRALRRCIATDQTKLRVGNVAIEYAQQRRRYCIGERLRPCPNPFCSKEDGCALRQCHGSGVLPARSRVNPGKTLAVEPADDLG